MTEHRDGETTECFVAERPGIAWTPRSTPSLWSTRTSVAATKRSRCRLFGRRGSKCTGERCGSPPRRGARAVRESRGSVVRRDPHDGPAADHAFRYTGRSASAVRRNRSCAPGRGRGPGATRRRACSRSSAASTSRQLALSAPSRLTPRRMNGATVVLSCMPAARPMALTVPPIFDVDSSHAQHVAAQVVDRPGPRRLVERADLAESRSPGAAAPPSRRVRADSGLPPACR